MEYHQDSFSVLMFPWLAHGHISPFLELAKKLSQRNFKVYLCSTPACLVSIKPKLAENFSASIQLVELHLPTLPGLPPEYHTTNGLPSHLMATLKQAFDMASPNFIKILETIEPDLLVYDMLQPWAPTAASALNIPAVEFISSSTTMTSFMLHVLKNNPGTKFPFSNIFHGDLEAILANKLHDDVKFRSKEINRVVQSLQLSSKIILIKSFKEIEGKYIDYLSLLSGKKVVPVGPLVQDPSSTHGNSDDNLEIMEWLDKKEKKSTVFVCFGTEYFLSKEDREEIAHGLELSNVNFIWAIRYPKGENLQLEEALPKGFLARVGERGMVVDGWVPQAKILGHSSVGGFVSHCGWNSVMESMKSGVPIVAIPMHLDQPVNARLIEEVGAGVEVLREDDGTLGREKVAAVIKQVMHEGIGQLVRERARSLSNKIEVKGDEEIDVVVDELVQLCLEKKMKDVKNF
ncbi:beta-D-glucosyl crocetin beta-1,6-glucosyltransferase-like [Coffea eugenioides]|uniref:beta-D-glucosyl crocetin beta-1,6-glucosyltransferase-like n=1 Tax=Coffea eugenioides TaxID=49369 RepID=UPI000F60BAC1|nr:beta-D-glucosyl crocetin beta-1,6-glucosyltransferase-like [Coffea eugenioides]